MEVTKATFPHMAEEIINLIGSCEFYAMDLEMTGIGVKGMRDDIGMTLTEAYPSKRAAAMKYMSFQFGLCLFHPNESTGGYTARPFNFQLRNGPFGDDIVVNMGAVHFLASNSMNFQPWLSQGIPYATKTVAAAERERFFPTKPSSLSEEETAWVAAQKTKIEAWAKDLEKAKEQPLEINVSHCSVEADVALHFALIEDATFQVKSSEGASLRVSAEPRLDGRMNRNRRTTKYTLVAKDDFDATEAAVSKKREKMVENSVGFRRIWDALVASRKPILAHNSSSDFLFNLNQHDDALPESFQEYRERLNELFPTIIDTKVIAQAIPVKDAPPSTGLEPLYKEMKKRAVKAGKAVPINLPLGFENYLEDVAKAQGPTPACAHQGAYDAYMTGIVYLQMKSLFGEDFVKPCVNLVAVFGSAFYISNQPGATEKDDPPASCVPFVATHPYDVESEDIEEAFATPEQLAELKAAKEAQQQQRAAAAAEGGRGPRRERVQKDYFYRRVDRNCHVILFSPGTEEQVPESRLKGKPTEGSITVQTFAAWKAANPTPAVSEDELPVKKARQ